MQIGDKVTSKLYAEKGTGTILGFTDLFGETCVSGKPVQLRKNRQG